MRVFAINCGSSTLKFKLVEMLGEGEEIAEKQRLAHGIVDKIGSQGSIRFIANSSGEELNETFHTANHREAMHRVLDWLSSLKTEPTISIEAVGHRVVHGGDYYTEPVLIDDEVIHAIKLVNQLAPLHNEPALAAITGTWERLGSGIQQVATFDTAFHATLPKQASMYAIPLELAQKYNIRRYGFHGLAHRYMTERHAVISGMPVEKGRLITLQLGNGCSAAAVYRGRSIDTSMGFTPLEGLVMGTRSGDLDPSLVSFLSQQESIKVSEIERWLNKRSGLLGVSGFSSDMRQLLKAESEGSDRAKQAIDMFCYRVRKYIGAYMTVLNGVDAIIFGGGIGENSAAVRRRICNGMEWCGIMLNEECNAAAIGADSLISHDNSSIDVYVVTVDEEAIIARDTVRCLQKSRK